MDVNRLFRVGPWYCNADGCCWMLMLARPGEFCCECWHCGLDDAVGVGIVAFEV